MDNESLERELRALDRLVVVRARRPRVRPSSTSCAYEIVGRYAGAGSFSASEDGSMEVRGVRDVKGWKWVDGMEVR